MRGQPTHLEALHKDLIEWFARNAPPHSVQTVEHTDLALGTSIGHREENQDRVAVVRFSAKDPRESLLLLALCDGMGGMRDGGSCASVALSSLIVSLAANKTEKLLKRILTAVQAANDEVYHLFAGEGGSTCACIAVDQEGTAIGMHVGDSRIYEYVPGGKVVTPLTLDDNIGNHVGRIIPLGEAMVDNDTFFSRQITQYIGQGEGLQPNFNESLHLEGRHYLITSDGAHTLPVDTFTQLIGRAHLPHEAVRRVLAVAKWCGGEDNASAICARSLKGLQANEAFGSANYLEVWDASGKLSFCFPQSNLSRAMAQYPEPKRQPELELGTATNFSLPKRVKLSRKAKAQRRLQKEKRAFHVDQKAEPSIEVINNE